MLSEFVRSLVTVSAVMFVGASGTPRGEASTAQPQPFAEDLAFPTNMAFSPDGRLFFTEKDTGNVRIVQDGALLPTPFATLPVVPDAERGLLGIAIDPRFPTQPWVYLYLSDAVDGVNRIVRMRAEGNHGGQPETLLDGLDSAAGYHNGGDLVFGIDGTLFASLGEAHDANRAQDPDDLGGKIVRLRPDGTVPADNPFGADNPVWSYGHRNSFGLCIDRESGELWETENGPDIDDEVNLIEGGANYGWPRVTGGAGGSDFSQPVVVFPETIAVTGCAVVDGDLFFGSFDGRLWRLRGDERDRGDAEEVASFPQGVTDVALGPDDMLYIATADSIWTMRLPGSGASASASPPVASAATASPSTLPVDEPSDGPSARDVIAIAAAIALAVGLGMRFAAGRRLRRSG
ncbi:MAG TPA: PQQ-dependent sugar dehydrogenase [Actinomycetota bacterium]